MANDRAMEIAQVTVQAGTTPSLQEQMEKEIKDAQDVVSGLEGDVSDAIAELNSHVPYIDETDHKWHVWNSQTQEWETKDDATGNNGKANKVHNGTEGHVVTLMPSDDSESDDDLYDIQDSNVPLSDLARKDGYYSTLTAGAAENLTGQNADTATWEERPVGGEGAEVATGLASVQAIGGNGIAWNQLVRNGSFSDVEDNKPKYWYKNANTTISAVDGKCRVYFDETNTNNGLLQYLPVTIPAGHIVYASFRAASVISNYFYIRALNSNTQSFSQGAVSGGTDYARTIFQLSNDVNAIYVAFMYNAVEGTYIDVDDFILIDLSLIFGLGNEPATVAEIEAWLAANIGTKPYYPYNAGTLLPAKLQGYKTTGKSANLLNPATRTARLFAYTWPDHNNMFTIKELPSGLTLTFTPDATGVSETIEPNSTTGHFSVSGSGNLVVSGSADLSATWLIATWDESMDDYDNFEAWDGKEYAFDTSKVYGKLNGEGDYVQVFPNGMRGAGSVHDVIDLQTMTADVNCGGVNLGDLNWGHDDTSSVEAASSGIASLMAYPQYSSIAANMITNKYDKHSYQGSSINNIIYTSWATADTKAIWIRDSAFVDKSSAQVKSLLNGVYLWYELATPKHYTDCVYRDNGVDTPLSKLNILVNNWAYEQAVVSASDNNGQPTSCAAQSTILYGIDAVEQLDTLKETGITVADLGNNLRALAAVIGPVMGGTLTVNDPSSGKTFGFSFTPSETPAE